MVSFYLLRSFSQEVVILKHMKYFIYIQITLKQHGEPGVVLKHIYKNNKCLSIERILKHMDHRTDYRFLLRCKVIDCFILILWVFLQRAKQVYHLVNNTKEIWYKKNTPKHGNIFVLIFRTWFTLIRFHTLEHRSCWYCFYKEVGTREKMNHCG